jgi:hypothetical protein
MSGRARGTREQVRSARLLALVGLCIWPQITQAQSRSDLASIEADLARAVDLKIDDIILLAQSSGRVACRCRVGG